MQRFINKLFSDSQLEAAPEHTQPHLVSIHLSHKAPNHPPTAPPAAPLAPFRADRDACLAANLFISGTIQTGASGASCGRNIAASSSADGCSVASSVLTLRMEKDRLNTDTTVDGWR